MKISRKFILPLRKPVEGDPASRVAGLETYIDDCMMLLEKFVDEIRVATNENESTVILADALPKASKAYRGKLIQLLKAPAASDELWIGTQGVSGDTFVKII